MRRPPPLLTLALAAGCVGGGAPPAPPAGPDGRTRVEITLEEFVAFEATEGERTLADVATGLVYGRRFFSPGDELWLVVAGRDPAGGVIARTLPDDDLFWALFSSPDADEGREDALPPQELWRGAIAPGERVELVVAVLEHDGPRADDAEPRRVPDAVVAGMGAAHRLAREAAALIAAATEPGDSVVGATTAIPLALGALLGAREHQLVGAFAVRVANDRGSLVADWRPLNGAKDRGDARFTRGRPLRPRIVRLGGAGSHYEAMVRVSATP